MPVWLDLEKVAKTFSVQMNGWGTFPCHFFLDGKHGLNIELAIEDLNRLPRVIVALIAKCD
jgi:hypothetical protein